MACMKKLRWPKEREEEVKATLRACQTRAEAAARLKVTAYSLDHGCQSYGFSATDYLGRGEELEVAVPPPSGMTKEELVADMKARYARRAANEDAKRLIPVKIGGDLPIGLMCAGDLHLDDPGTNIHLIEKHARLTRDTPGMYGCTPGDLLNLWIGRLARLYAHQNVTASEGWMLVEWYVELVRDWLFVVLGNHDMWAGDGSPMDWIARRAGLFSQAHDVRMALRFTNGREVRVHCRHDFPGNSMYNDSHGLLRAAIFGHRDHVKLAGHKHISSQMLASDPDTGIAMHLVRVAGYKQIDDFKDERGYMKKSFGPACMLLIDPRLPDDHPDLVKEYWDPEEGADYLRFARKRRAPEKARRAA